VPFILFIIILIVILVILVVSSSSSHPRRLITSSSSSSHPRHHPRRLIHSFSLVHQSVFSFFFCPFLSLRKSVSSSIELSPSVHLSLIASLLHANPRPCHPRHYTLSEAHHLKKIVRSTLSEVHHPGHIKFSLHGHCHPCSVLSPRIIRSIAFLDIGRLDSQY